MIIESLDHLVLTVKNIDATSKFYCEILGMEMVNSNNRIALKFGNQKMNLHEQGKEFEPKAHLPTPGSGDVCFISFTPVEQIVEELRTKNVTIEEGVVERTGAKGKLRSVYIRDPDLNLIEISNYQ
jgi:catechol 2,3-dioxygenase-like lactoylglutathione lyase family enzyme